MKNSPLNFTGDISAIIGISACIMDNGSLGNTEKEIYNWRPQTLDQAPALFNEEVSPCVTTKSLHCSHYHLAITLMPELETNQHVSNGNVNCI